MSSMKSMADFLALAFAFWRRYTSKKCITMREYANSTGQCVVKCPAKALRLCGCQSHVPCTYSHTLPRSYNRSAIRTSEKSLQPRIFRSPLRYIFNCAKKTVSWWAKTTQKRLILSLQASKPRSPQTGLGMIFG